MNMNIGDKVRTTDDWNTRFRMPYPVTGTVYRIEPVGPMREHRNHQVKLDEELRPGVTSMWFDPNDLELSD